MDSPLRHIFRPARSDASPKAGNRRGVLAAFVATWLLASVFVPCVLWTTSHAQPPAIAQPPKAAAPIELAKPSERDRQVARMIAALMPRNHISAQSLERHDQPTVSRTVHQFARSDEALLLSERHR